MAVRRSGEDVELNVASMLDLAFQLLTFFILTFRPPPVESEIAMRMPPAMPAVRTDALPPPSGKQPVEVQGVNTLAIRLFSESGGLDHISVGEVSMRDLAELREKMKDFFGDRSSPFEQVVLQVSCHLRYGEMFKVLDLCAQQRLPDGQPLGKLSFVVMDDKKTGP
jgi:biopolymer transport protein ExbD